MEIKRIYNPMIRHPYLIYPNIYVIIALSVMSLIVEDRFAIIGMLWSYWLLYHCINDKRQKRKAKYYQKLILDNYKEVNIGWEGALSNYIGWEETKKVMHEAWLMREKDRLEEEAKKTN